ncbi:hypothetical protein C8N31_103380 [Sulfitobacter mediterraneus]|uniref:Uncharacterized protein n=1 Tax=Sulfitobacter mediterraneus TaxID=83219 RepID=A0A2T6CHB9_9RHOB|nr:hypothetical protein C8N31_103380 [Sulfitobacter mediterraneus]
MSKYSSKYSICATCANWVGARKAVGQRGNYKLVKALEQEGDCYEQNLRKGATATCNQFELWGVLKR